MPARVAVVGSANVDLVCRVERLPRPGETVTGGRFFSAAGGKGANQAVAAARLGAQVAFVARVGDDGHGREALAGYRAEGLDITRVSVDPSQPTGVALILVEAAGENVIAVASGANAGLSPADAAAAGEAIRAAQVLLLQLEVPLPTVLAAARAARAAGVTVILNPAPMPSDGLPAELLAAVDVLTPNEREAEVLGGEAALRGLEPTVVLTRGRRGALVVEADRVVAVPAPEVTAVDTVGAGDAFNGALAVAMAEGRPLAEAVAWACAAGALAATRSGAQPSLPTRVELTCFLGGGAA